MSCAWRSRNMSPDNLIRLRHMAEATQQALTFCAGKSRADLDPNVMLRMALLHVIQIVGEAAARMSAQGRAAAPGLQWPLIVSMRNRLVHAYFDVDTAIRWSTVQHSLPPLLAQLRTVPGVASNPDDSA
ncbi:MAG: DUF86 domain-containing protein [Rubrivivax sp.]|nr:DUF86 domain-containing protein [Rubrivivax sp.]